MGTIPRKSRKKSMRAVLTVLKYDDWVNENDADGPYLGEGSPGAQDKGRGREENLLGPENGNLWLL